MVADKWLSISCSVLIIALLLAGCLPIPTVPHGLGVVPDIEAFESLRPEAATRADVLLLLGEPNYRFDDDRFLMYEWTVAYGYVIVGGYTQAYPVPVAAPHYLCLEFGPDSLLVRREKLTGSLYAKPNKAIRRCVKQSEEPDVNIKEKAVVLLNIQCTVDNQPYESFTKPTFSADPIFLLGLGSFETAGEPQLRSIDNRFFSEETRRAGWTYFMLSPGIYYLAVLGPDATMNWEALRKAPRWRIDVPENVKAVYAGTLQFAGKSEKLLFGAKRVIPVGTDEPTIRDDHLLANDLISEYFPDAGKPKTILMQRWRSGDPISISSQGQKSGANTDTTQ